jgi:hypothetical protein
MAGLMMISGLRRFRSPDTDQLQQHRRGEGRPSEQGQPARVRGDRRGQGGHRGGLPGRRLLRRRRRLRGARRVQRAQQRPGQHPRGGGAARRARVVRQRDGPAARPIPEHHGAPEKLRRQGAHLGRDGHALRRAHHRPRPLRLLLRPVRRHGPGLRRQAQGAVQRRQQQLREPGRRHAQRAGQAVLPERDRQEGAVQLGRRAQLHGGHNGGHTERQGCQHVGEEVRAGHGDHGQNRGHDHTRPGFRDQEGVLQGQLRPTGGWWLHVICVLRLEYRTIYIYIYIYIIVDNCIRVHVSKLMNQ